MLEPKAKSVVKKVTEVKVKSRTAAATESKKKVAAAEPAAKKKAVAKKKVVDVVEPKKTKVPAVKKVTAAAEKVKVPARKAAATKAVAPALSGKQVIKPTPEERYRMIETAAYFIAEQHGFQGRSDAHWAAAERQIAAKLGE